MGSILVYVVIGFCAQMIDGALGMAYGICSTSFLLGAGLSPAAASASVHMSEVFTTLVSGISHLKLKNVDKKLFGKLVIPGVIGGLIGAFILSRIPGGIIRPFINTYLFVMGIVILVKAFKKKRTFSELSGKKATILGLTGGFFDALGGGGWGPVVTSTLLGMGYCPRFVVGSVNLAEFFVTTCQTAAFVTLVGFWDNFYIMLGLAAGGVMSAPVAAMICKRLPGNMLMILVGCVIASMNLWNIISYIF